MAAAPTSVNVRVDFAAASGAALPAALEWWHGKNATTSVTAGEGLVIKPAAKTDMWQRTHYGFVNDNAPALVTTVTGDFVAITRSRLSPVTQYDQAGLLVRFDEGTWLKTSCEYIPGGPSKLGAVVTNGAYSDWSTQPATGNQLAFYFRVARLGTAFFVHVRADETAPWFLVRLAHLTASPDVPCQVGLYACCPLGEGGSAAFDFLEVRAPREGEVSLHSS